MQKKRIIILFISIILSICVFAFGTFAWLYNRNAMITLAPVLHPGSIAITGPDGKAMESFDLSYTTDDIVVNQDGSKTVKIQRGFCVKSTDELFSLEIVHTTNMRDLKFNLYRSDHTSTPIEGSYLNKEKNENNHIYASNTLHNKNFADSDNVQIHAKPIYWKVGANQISDVDKTVTENFSGTNIIYYLTDYIIEISWTETEKETDIFYVLAKNVEN